ARLEVLGLLRRLRAPVRVRVAARELAERIPRAGELADLGLAGREVEQGAGLRIELLALLERRARLGVALVLHQLAALLERRLRRILGVRARGDGNDDGQR